LIAPSTIQEILSRIDILEIVGSFVKLKKRGTNYLGLCPFHNEKTPSFTVSPSKEIFKCFGCGKSGNSIGFIMEHEKFGYVEALRWLAARYNITIEETERSPEQKLQQQQADSLYIINQFAQQFFSDYLMKNQEGRDIGLSYLQERGFSDAIIEKFQLGFNSESKDKFATAALQAQYNSDLLLKSGLVAQRDGGLADNYRGRIIFPVHGPSGKILGFGARIIKKNDRAPKYINTPENEIYVKSKILYGSYFAKHAIDKADECLLVEGYTDVIALHQAGIENVVASGGTALTPDQLRLIKKFTRNLTIIYDGDAAGIKAALRGTDLAMEEGLHVKLVLIPDNDDPDSLVRKNGAEHFRNFIAGNKKDVILFHLETSLTDAGDDSVKKSKLVNQIAETISRINKVEDFTRQQDYIRQCAQLLQIEESGLQTLVNKIIRERVIKAETATPSSGPAPDADLHDPSGPGDAQTSGEDDAAYLLQKDEHQERALVRCLIEFGHLPFEEERSVADYIFNEIVENELEQAFENHQLMQIVKSYQDLISEGREPSSKSFLYHEDPAISSLAIAIMEFRHEVSANWKKFYEGKIPTREELYRQEVFSSMNYLKLRKVKRMIFQNQQEMQHNSSPEEQLVQMKVHLHLKELEKSLTQKIGTVILK
jgi:DNA primase